MEKDEELEQNIREKAHELWQQAGSPSDQKEEFWHRAHEIVLNGWSLDGTSNVKGPASQS